MTKSFIAFLVVIGQEGLLLPVVHKYIKHCILSSRNTIEYFCKWITRLHPLLKISKTYHIKEITFILQIT
jgi:hypothetical protein